VQIVLEQNSYQCERLPLEYIQNTCSHQCECSLTPTTLLGLRRPSGTNEYDKSVCSLWN